MRNNDIEDVEKYMRETYHAEISRWWHVTPDGGRLGLFYSGLDVGYLVKLGDNGHFGIYEYKDAKKVNDGKVVDQ